MMELRTITIASEATWPHRPTTSPVENKSRTQTSAGHQALVQLPLNALLVMGCEVECIFLGVVVCTGVMLPIGC